MPPAYEVLLLNTAVPQIQAAQSGDTYVVPRDIAFSAALTLSAGTANGVPYLNGSKVLTSGGALTFDGTDVGIGGAPVTGLPLRLLRTSSGAQIRYQNTAATWDSGVTAAGAYEIFSAANTSIQFGVNSSEQMRLTSKAFMVGYTDDSGFSGQYNAAFSGNVGIGTSSPNAKLRIQNDNSTIPSLLIRDGGTPAANMIEVSSNATGDALILNASGNLGLGVTPSAWVDDKALQLPQGSVSSGYEYGISVAAGAYRSASNVWIYTQSAAGVSRFNQVNGVHQWFTAPSGTAGNAISFTQAMTLTEAGDLGVGTTSPDVLGLGYGRILGLSSASSVGVQMNAAFGSTSNIDMAVNGTRRFQTEVGNSDVILKTRGAVPLLFGTDNTERARITSGGNFKIGGSADRATTEGDKQLVIFDGTAPVGTLANGISLYSSSGEAYVMDAAGNATLFSPHDAATNEWIFRSKHTPTGKVLKIDVERLLKFVNDHFGLDAVHEFIED